MKSSLTVHISSPCNGICQLDDADVCLGCFRSRDEIARWTRMTANEQFTAIIAVKARRGILARNQNNEE
jgi:predicted Fe-S protein YdhL (DUF1289 family)